MRFSKCESLDKLVILPQYEFMSHELRYDILGVKIAYRETVNLVQMKAVDIAFDDRVTQQRLILRINS